MKKLPKLWDAKTLDARTQAKIGRAETARSDQDWLSALIHAERVSADARGCSANCPLPACRRARGCRGNPTICLPDNVGEPARMQATIYDIYVQIQQQRRAAAWRRRPLDVVVPVTRPLRRARRKKSRRKIISVVPANAGTHTPCRS